MNKTKTNSNSKEKSLAKEAMKVELQLKKYETEVLNDPAVPFVKIEDEIKQNHELSRTIYRTIRVMQSFILNPVVYDEVIAKLEELDLDERPELKQIYSFILINRDLIEDIQANNYLSQTQLTEWINSLIMEFRLQNPKIGLSFEAAFGVSELGDLLNQQAPKPIVIKMDGKEYRFMANKKLNGVEVEGADQDAENPILLLKLVKELLSTQGQISKKLTSAIYGKLYLTFKICIEIDVVLALLDIMDKNKLMIFVNNYLGFRYKEILKTNSTNLNITREDIGVMHLIIKQYLVSYEYLEEEHLWEYSKYL